MAFVWSDIFALRWEDRGVTILCYRQPVKIIGSGCLADNSNCCSSVETSPCPSGDMRDDHENRTGKGVRQCPLDKAIR